MHPEVQVVDGDVRPDVSNLLLARSPDFLDVVEVLFARGTVGKGFQYFHRTGFRLSTEERKPTMIFFDQHNSDNAADRSVSGQEGFVTVSPYSVHSAVCQPRFCPARLARLILFLPYLRGRPRPRGFPGFNLGGKSRRAASFRKRPTTTTPESFRARSRKGRLV